jgi:hypothetical protein
MAVAIITTDFPEGVGTPMYDAVRPEIEAAGAPEGLIFHWAGEMNGKWTISEVWESREACDRFRQERLFPTIKRVSGRDPEEGPQPTITEHPVHHYMSG